LKNDIGDTAMFLASNVQLGRVVDIGPEAVEKIRVSRSLARLAFKLHARLRDKTLE
jgi:hypothetical protein